MSKDSDSIESCGGDKPDVTPKDQPESEGHLARTPATEPKGQVQPQPQQPEPDLRQQQPPPPLPPPPPTPPQQPHPQPQEQQQPQPQPQQQQPQQKQQQLQQEEEEQQQPKQAQAGGFGGEGSCESPGGNAAVDSSQSPLSTKRAVTPKSQILDALAVFPSSGGSPSPGACPGGNTALPGMCRSGMSSGAPSPTVAEPDAAFPSPPTSPVPKPSGHLEATPKDSEVEAEEENSDEEDDEDEAPNEDAGLGSTASYAPQTPSGSLVHRWAEDLPGVKPTDDQTVRVFCGVWNLHGKPAPADVGPWLLTKPGHHIYVVGTCECERSIEKSMIWKDKSRWETQVKHHLGEDYRMIKSHNMSAIHVMVFVHRHLWRYVWDIKSAQVATGFANFVGNKGGAQIGFNIGHTSMLFTNAHLAAHANKMKLRTQNLTRILTDSTLRRDKTRSGVHEDYDRVFFMGDLNPRVSARRSDVDQWLQAREFEKCLERDQLRPLLLADSAGQADAAAGFWPHFQEAAINFPPTYKFDAHTDRYDSSKKQRVPSWTDRILWKRDPQVRAKAYGSVQCLQSSDHRPIFAQFEVTVDLTDWEGPQSEANGGKKSSSVCTLQ